MTTSHANVSARSVDAALMAGGEESTDYLSAHVLLMTAILDCKSKACLGLQDQDIRLDHQHPQALAVTTMSRE